MKLKNRFSRFHLCIGLTLTIFSSIAHSQSRTTNSDASVAPDAGERVEPYVRSDLSDATLKLNSNLVFEPGIMGQGLPPPKSPKFRGNLTCYCSITMNNYFPDAQLIFSKGREFRVSKIQNNEKSNSLEFILEEDHPPASSKQLRKLSMITCTTHNENPCDPDDILGSISNFFNIKHFEYPNMEAGPGSKQVPPRVKHSI